MPICKLLRRLGSGLVFGAAVVPWPAPARADYFVPVATVDQGGTSSANDTDGLCNLAEAIDSINRGMDRHGCVNDGLGDGHGIWLDTSMVLVNGQWMPPMYLLDRAARIRSTIAINSGNGEAIIQGKSSAGVFIVESSGVLSIAFVTVQHDSGLPGRVITNHGSLDLYGMVLQNGNVQYQSGTDAAGVRAGDGGGIYNDGHLTLQQVSILFNSAKRGGGIFNAGGSGGMGLDADRSTFAHNWSTGNGGALYSASRVRLWDSTLSSNSASGNGGGVYTADGYLEFNRCTVTFNVANGRGGGVYATIQAHRTMSSIFARNGAIGGAPDYLGDPHSGSRNADGTARNEPASLFSRSDGVQGIPAPGDLLDVDAGLGPLWDNGGPTRTHALDVSSPAHDAGEASNCWGGEDQRGYPRYVGSFDPATGYCRSDLGAYQIQP